MFFKCRRRCCCCFHSCILKLFVFDFSISDLKVFSFFNENKKTDMISSAALLVARPTPLSFRCEHVPRSAHLQYSMSIYFQRFARPLFSPAHHDRSAVSCYYRRSYATRNSSASHYDALGVTVDASPKEIKAAFYKLSKKHHPDVNPEDANAAQKFSTISNAYDILGDPVKRRDYDNELSSQTSASDPYVTYNRTSSYAQRARAHRPSAWKPPPSSRNASGGFQGAENAFGSNNFGTFDKGQYDAAFGRFRGPSPSGRSNIYDFDEFYRAHYSDFRSWTTNRKEAQEKARRDRSTAESTRQERAKRTTLERFSSVALWFSFGAVLLLLSNILHDMHFQRPSDELRSKFYLVPKASNPESARKS